MSYMQALHKLRKSIREEPREEPSVTRSSSSFITPREREAPAEADPLAMSREWIQTIRSSGATFRANNKVEIPDYSEPAKPAPEKKPELITEEDEKPQGERRSMFDGVEPLSGADGKVVDIGSATTLKEVIDITEGGGSYDTLFGHSQKDKFAGVDVSTMTIGELKEFSAPSGAYGQWVKGKVGRVATPMGRYQFVGSTLGQVANEMGLPDSTVFSPRVQDAMFDFQANKVMSRGSTLQEKVTRLRSEWEGLKGVPTAKLVSIVRNTV